MAMTKASLKSRIETEIQALFNIQDASQLDKMSEAIANAVIDEVQINAQGTGSTNVTSGSSAGVYVTTIPPGGIT